MRYTVYVSSFVTFDNVIGETDSEHKAISLAKKAASNTDNYVFISCSDATGNRGYLNKDGYDCVGRSWAHEL